MRFPFRKAINYSGYREGQSPITKDFPSKDEILEDLLILQGEYYYLRIYDCSTHAYRVLEVIEENKLEFEVLLGLSLFAEENHEEHPFFHKHSEESMKNNRIQNAERVEEIIFLGIKYREIVSAISIGNEILSFWSNRRLPVSRMIEITKTIQERTQIPVTYCEEYHIWVEELEELGKVIDFISLHTYPAWQGFSIDEAVDVAVENFNFVQNKFPDKYCIITETGWPTKSHGSRIKIEYANAANQRIYNSQITKWGEENNTLIYLFEAFDESWKGGNHPDEPEKNWGIYDVNRKLKK